MSNKIFTVSVGIPAYNEEANIKKLLLNILSQKEDGFTLKEIIVASDGSVDGTEKEVLSVPDKRIRLLAFKERVGQAIRQNEIVKEVSGDLVLLLNADILLVGDNFIAELVKPFNQIENLALASPLFRPTKPKTFFERIINYSVSMKDYMFESWNKGENLFMCVGRTRMFSSSFIKSFSWPGALSEDAFSYLKCLEMGLRFIPVLSAKVLFRSPSNFKDHVRQSSRFLNGSEIMKQFFPEQLVDESYSIPLVIRLKTISLYFFKNPLFFSAYMGILLYSKIYSYKKTTRANVWKVATSSKTIQ